MFNALLVSGGLVAIAGVVVLATADTPQREMVPAIMQTMIGLGMTGAGLLLVLIAIIGEVLR